MGCLKPTNVEELYLSGIVIPSIRRDVCARVEKAKQETNEAHSLHRQIPVERCLKSRNCYLHFVKPANFPPNVIRCSEWLRTCQPMDNVEVSQQTAYMQQRKKWQYFDRDTIYECGGETEKTMHMLQCTLHLQ